MTDLQVQGSLIILVIGICALILELGFGKWYKERFIHNDYELVTSEVFSGLFFLIMLTIAPTAIFGFMVLISAMDKIF